MSTFDHDTGDPRWERINFKWYWANFTAPEASTDSSIFFLDKNPGDYEVKVLCGALCRETKFSIGSDRKFVDNGIVATNKLNSPAILVPVKVIGTSDGQWQPLSSNDKTLVRFYLPINEVASKASGNNRTNHFLLKDS